VTEQPRYFFVHLQKTGGTALFQRLRDGFGSDAVYPTSQDNGDVRAVTDIHHLVSRYASQRGELEVITGHFPLCAVDVLGDPFTTFTLLRDPVERTLSLLRRRQERDPRFAGMALEAIYEDADLQPVMQNHMVKMLSMRPEEMGPTPITAVITFDRPRLERAKERLATVDLVGLQEQFDEFCAALEQRLGRDLGPPRFANRTAPQPVADAFRARIAADNAADAELHEFAAELISARGDQGSSRV
jgi:hypothetical protein